MTNATKTEAQSCYPEEIETLRAIREGFAGELGDWNSRPASNLKAASVSLLRHRIEALTTAIEALGGAL